MIYHYTLVSMICNIHDSASLVLDCKSWTLGLDSLVPCLVIDSIILRSTRLSKKLLEQGYVKERLKSPLRKFYGR